MRINSYNEFLEASPIDEGTYEKFCRNDVSFHTIKGKLVVLKKFRNRESARREGAAYEVFMDNPIVRVPFRYFAEGDIALYDLVKSNGESDLLKRVGDWARIHSRKDLSSIFENRNPSKMQLRKVIQKVRERGDLFGGNHNAYADVIEGGLDYLVQPPIQTFTHGDLRVNNSISTKEGEYYIDFEFSGITHPAEDLAPSLLAYPHMRRAILQSYEANSSLDFGQIKKALPLYILFRSSRVILMQEKRGLMEDIRLPVRKKFVSVMEDLIKN